MHQHHSRLRRFRIRSFLTTPRLRGARCFPYGIHGQHCAEPGQFISTPHERAISHSRSVALDIDAAFVLPGYLERNHDQQLRDHLRSTARSEQTTLVLARIPNGDTAGSTASWPTPQRLPMTAVARAGRARPPCAGHPLAGKTSAPFRRTGAEPQARLQATLLRCLRLYS